MNSLISKSLAAAVLAVAGAGTAQAAIYVGTWDPAYGAPFTAGNNSFSIDNIPGAYNLGWRGQEKIDVGSSCSAGVGAGLQTVAVGVNCTAQAISAFVQLYNASIPLDLVGLETLNWNAASLGAVNSLLYFNGALVGFDTAFSTALQSAHVKYLGDLVSFGLSLTYNLQASFGGDAFAASDGPVPGTTFVGPVLNWSTCGGDCGSGTNNRSIPINFSVQVVPEPGSLALAALALIGAGWGRRRSLKAAR